MMAPNFVVGGATNSCLYKIGRVRVQTEVVVGRVTCELDNAVLYVAHDAREISATIYEILVYSSETVIVDFPKALDCQK